MPPASPMATRSETNDHVAFLRRVESALADGMDPVTATAYFPDDVVIQIAVLFEPGSAP